MGLRDFVYEPSPRADFSAPVVIKMPSDEKFERKNDARWRKTAQDWKDTKEQIKALEETERYLREELILMAEERNCFGAGIQVEKIERSGNISYADIPQLQGVNLDQFRKPNSQYWKITEV